MPPKADTDPKKDETPTTETPDAAAEKADEERKIAADEKAAAKDKKVEGWQKRATRAPKKGDVIICHYVANGAVTRRVSGRVTKLPKKGELELEAQVTIAGRTSLMMFSPEGTSGAGFTWRHLGAKEKLSS